MLRHETADTRDAVHGPNPARDSVRDSNGPLVDGSSAYETLRCHKPCARRPNDVSDAVARVTH